MKLQEIDIKLMYKTEDQYHWSCIFMVEGNPVKHGFEIWLKDGIWDRQPIKMKRFDGNWVFGCSPNGSFMGDRMIQVFEELTLLIKKHSHFRLKILPFHETYYGRFNKQSTTCPEHFILNEEKWR